MSASSPEASAHGIPGEMGAVSRGLLWIQSSHEFEPIVVALSGVHSDREPGELMDITVKFDAPNAFAECVGRFTFDDHQRFKETMMKVLEIQGVKVLTLELSGLSYLDSSSLGALLLLKERAAMKGVTIVLAHPTPSVLKILNVVNFSRVFEIITPDRLPH